MNTPSRISFVVSWLWRLYMIGLAIYTVITLYRNIMSFFFEEEEVTDE